MHEDHLLSAAHTAYTSTLADHWVAWWEVIIAGISLVEIRLDYTIKKRGFE